MCISFYIISLCMGLCIHHHSQDTEQCHHLKDPFGCYPIITAPTSLLLPPSPPGADSNKFSISKVSTSGLVVGFGYYKYHLCFWPCIFSNEFLANYWTNKIWFVKKSLWIPYQSITIFNVEATQSKRKLEDFGFGRIVFKKRGGGLHHFFLVRPEASYLTLLHHHPSLHPASLYLC